jgi:4-hydroxy-tetrahydrodipicolinate reductase
MSEAITLAVTGAGGRMGRRLVALAAEHGLQVTAALERAGSEFVGRDAGELSGAGALGTKVGTELPGQAPAVLIDFTAPAGLRQWLPVCQQKKIAVVVGTTGLTDADHAMIDEAAREIAVLQSPNMSLGVNLLFRVAAQVAKVLGDDYDIEITEAHHRFKKDAPSGTAMGLADAILKATGKGRDRLVYDRHGDESERKRGDIGMTSLRMGDEVGMHTAYFATQGERLELTHRASTRDTFAHGALRAARWLAGMEPGRYSMGDVLGI